MNAFVCQSVRPHIAKALLILKIKMQVSGPDILCEFRKSRKIFKVSLFLFNAGGDQANICGRYAENLFRVIFGAHPQIFSKYDVFFPQHFRDPPIFSRNCKYFPLEFGDLPAFCGHKSTENVHLLIFGPLDLRLLSIFERLFGAHFPCKKGGENVPVEST